MVGAGLILADLVQAYEAPSPDANWAIAIDLAKMRKSNWQAYKVMSAVVSRWNALYANPNYPLSIYYGGEYADTLEDAEIPDDDTHALVVLGLELADGQMQSELKGRCDAAAAAARSFPHALLVCSGGQTGENNPEEHTEARLMKDYLVSECGIDDSRVLIEERACTTAENARYTLETLRAHKIETMTIVTSSYHQRRAQVVFGALAAR